LTSGTLTVTSTGAYSRKGSLQSPSSCFNLSAIRAALPGPASSQRFSLEASDPFRCRLYSIQLAQVCGCSSHEQRVRAYSKIGVTKAEYILSMFFESKERVILGIASTLVLVLDITTAHTTHALQCVLVQCCAPAGSLLAADFGVFGQFVLIKRMCSNCR